MHKNYKLTDQHDGIQSAFQPFASQLESVPIVGSYNNGLLAVVDAVASKTLLRNWSWLVGDKCIPLITTGFGDVFFWDAKGVNFLEVQRGTIEFVDSELTWFLQDFLVNLEIVDKVLKKKTFDQLVSSFSPLNYHKIFILEPWMSLGGVDRIENYTMGKCSTYLNLVGQSFK